MTDADMRFACYELAYAIRGRLSAIRVPDKQLAESFVSFCEGNEIRLKALQMAVSKAEARHSLDAVSASAETILEFVTPPKPEPAPVFTKKKTGRRRTS